MFDRVELSWLPPAPVDFNFRLKEAVEGERGFGRALHQIAAGTLDINKLNRLSKALRIARAQGRDMRPLNAFKLGILSNSTTQLIAPAIEATGLRHGFAVEIIETPFGQLVQEALDPHSVLATAQPDAILIALDVHGLSLPATPGDLQAAETNVAAAINQLAVIRKGLHANTNAMLIVQTVARQPETLFGSYDFRLPGTSRWLIERFNRSLADQVGADELLVDVGGLAETVGLDRWHDPSQRHIAKLPFAQAMVPLYADHVMRVISALRGKSRRALVLDLDNTLWGGVIGDDGLEGIAIGQGSPLGESHLSVQQSALDLHGRGVVLAVSSKNEDAAARLPFREHIDMLLREEHIAIFQANWVDKASNIGSIADALTLGRDALVFLDDNPAERLQVRGTHPEIAVPELPADAAYYARTLNSAGYFEAVAFSDDDRKRSGFYQDNARRLQMQSGAESLDAYHASLLMVATFQPFDVIGRSRIAQLISKSNQFNLTTRRYSEAQVEALEHDAKVWTLQARLADIFGDNGMISVVVCRKHPGVWDIDTWLMSCRVLGRRMEEAVLHEIARAAREAGADALTGDYVPTERNAMVARHFEKLGFEKVAESTSGETRWRLALADLPRVDLPMDIIRPIPNPV